MASGVGSRSAALSLRPRWLRPAAIGVAGVAHLCIIGAFLLAPEAPSSAEDSQDVAYVLEGESALPRTDDAPPDEQVEHDKPTIAQAAAEAQRDEAPKVTTPDSATPLAMEKPQEIAPDAITVPLVEKKTEEPERPTLKPKTKAKEAEQEPTPDQTVKDKTGEVVRVATAAAEAVAASAASSERIGALEGRQAASSASRARYGAKVLAEIQRHMFYPREARARSMTGHAVVVFTVGAEGRIIDRQIARSTGSPSLDQAALAMLDKVQAPPPPAGRFLGQTTIRFDIKR